MTDTIETSTWRFADPDWVASTAPVLAMSAEHGAGGVTVFVHGELDAASAPALQRRLVELLALPIESMTVDLTCLRLVDGSGLNAFVDARASADEHGVPFALDGGSAGVRHTLEANGLSSLFAMTERPRASTS
jgi:anti-anti-sigma factor